MALEWFSILRCRIRDSRNPQGASLWLSPGGTPGRYNPSAIAPAQLLVSNRLIEPLSEGVLIDWSHRTAFPELLDIRLTKSAKDRLYRTSDDFMAHRKDIEFALRQRERDLFSLSRSGILYDVTNSYFEGFCKSNPKAKHGKNEQHCNDCRQIAVGTAFDEHGSRSPTAARSTSASQGKPTTNKNTSLKCSSSTGNPPSQPEKPKFQREEMGVPLGRPSRFYAGLRSAVRNVG